MATKRQLCNTAQVLCPYGIFLEIKTYVGQGKLNLPPQNMPPWHKDYFELVMFKKQQTEEKL